MTALCLAIGLGGLATYCEHRATVRHAEILSLRAAIRPGMTPAEVDGVFRGLQLSHLKAGTPMKSMLQFYYDGNASDWVLWISLHEARTTAVRVRTVDSAHEQPDDAPADLVWATEDACSYWNDWTAKECVEQRSTPEAPVR